MTENDQAPEMSSAATNLSMNAKEAIEEGKRQIEAVDNDIEQYKYNYASSYVTLMSQAALRLLEKDSSDLDKVISTASEFAKKLSAEAAILDKHFYDSAEVPAILRERKLAASHQFTELSDQIRKAAKMIDEPKIALVK